ncbi:MAG: VOC family protein [Gemmataceae bacterium]
MSCTEAVACPRLGDDGDESRSLTNSMRSAHLRVARPSDDLPAVVRFYRDGLGFEVLAEFRDHDGFDGVMLGHRGAAYHLEFTRKAGHAAGRAPTADNLLVFYLPDAGEWRAAVARLEALGHAAVPAFNPYWDRQGKTFEDPDGYRVVLQNAGWPARDRG